MKTIATIGSSGTNARPWTDAFLVAGWHVRSLVRDPGKIESRPHLSAAAFDFGDPKSHAPALAGVDVLALISPAQPNQVAWESALIAAAQRAAVGGIIKLSVLGAEMAAPISFFARNAAETERLLRASSNRPHRAWPAGVADRCVRRAARGDTGWAGAAPCRCDEGRGGRHRAAAAIVRAIRGARIRPAEIEHEKSLPSDLNRGWMPVFRKRSCSTKMPECQSIQSEAIGALAPLTGRALSCHGA